MIIEGTFALQISRETVPDFETANIDLFNICFLIFSSEITSTLFKFNFLILLLIKFLFPLVAWKTKVKLSNFLFIIKINSIKIGKSKFTSESLLPQKREIIFLLFGIMLDKSILLLDSCSSKGLPTKVFGIFSLSKY